MFIFLLLQAFSRFKLLLSGALIVGCPIITYGYINDSISSSLFFAFMGSAAFSSCTLIIYSWISTKIVGVISVHKTSGLMRIGHLTFWGRRQNKILNVNQIIPPSDLQDAPEVNKSVRFGVISEEDGQHSKQSVIKIKQTFFLTRIKSEIIDKDLFKSIFGFTW
ncbi:unnamed protein product [Trichobilharzia regenti]|nr:unnamed protein product [Trichobilharzia regenti]